MNYEEYIDVPSAKERFMGNYGLFSKFLFRFPAEARFEELSEQVAAGDAKAGFETAHAMKGVIGNLSLKRIEPDLFEVVEILRKGDLPDGERMQKLEASYRATLDAIDALQKDGTALF